MNILILGAGYAGINAAMRLAKKAPQANITLINAQATFVNRVRNHQLMAGQPLKQRPIADILRATHVNFVQDDVKHIDLKARRVDTETQSFAYDRLIYALGSVTHVDAVSGAREHTYTLDTQSAKAFSERLPVMAAEAGTVVIVGAGLTGIETAAELAEQYPRLHIKLINSGTFQPMFSAKGADYLKRQLTRMGIDLLENTRVERIEKRYLTTNHGDIPFNACVWAGGFKANPLAREVGFRVNERGQILTDMALRSISHPDVYALGDAGIPVETLGAPMIMACYTACMSATYGVDNLVAELNNNPFTPINPEYAIYCVSLGRGNAMIQLLNPNRTPKERIITGKLGVIIKELIVRGVEWNFGWQYRLPGIISFPGMGKAQQKRSRQLRLQEQQ